MSSRPSQRGSILHVAMLAVIACAVAAPSSAQGTPLDARIRWRALVPGRALTNYVTTAQNGTVYVNSDERLMALDLGGTLQWEVLNTSNREARPINVRADRTLVVGGLGFGQVTALNSDGSLLWAYSSTGNRLLAGPSLGPSGNVYAVADNLGTFSLDFAGGLRWVGDYFNSTATNNSPLVFDASRFFAGLAGFSSGLSLYVYDLNNGQEVWSSSSIGIPWRGHPVLDPSGRVVGPRFPTWVQALQPDSGQLVWSSQHPGQANFLVNQPKVGTNGVIYTSDMSGADLWAINPNGSTLWFHPDGPDTMNKLSVSPNDAIILAQGLTTNNQTGTSARWLRGYDTSNGSLLWQIDLPNENGVGVHFPGFDVAFTPDSRTAYVTTSYFPASGDYGYLYAIALTDEVGTNFCSGNGGDQMGCTDCPCGNNASQSTVGGCINSAARSALLVATGVPSVAADSMRVEMSGGSVNSFAILMSGAALAPTNALSPCFGLNSGVVSVSLDGLRCAVQSVQRHGVRPTDANGDVGATASGWGPPDGPPVGLIAQGGFGVGQTRHYQVIYRDNPALGCMTGQNTSQAVSITIRP